MKDEQNGHDERDDVGTLVRIAGPRKPVPADRTARVRAAARAQWQGEVKSRSRRRYAWSTAALATAATVVLAIALWIGMKEPAGPRPTILVESVTGSALIHAAAADGTTQPRTVHGGDTFLVGSELVTGETGQAAIRLASGHSIRLDTETRIRIIDVNLVALDRGAVYVDSGFEQAKGGAIKVRTPFGEVREIGTQFEVRLDPSSLRVRLREGEVVVSRDSSKHQVAAGFELTLAEDGTPTTRAIATYGTGWQWVADITPMLGLEGRSARSFLDWVARERGWTLAFTDETLARNAEQIVLDGTLSSLNLDQALDAVLPTCRLTYRVENGVLLIDGEESD